MSTEVEEPAPRPVVATRPQPQQLEVRVCPYCQSMFHPARPRQQFCKRQCGKWYYEDVGTEGQVASVVRLMRGRVSVVMHFENGPAAERAIRLLKGERKRVV